MPHLIVTKSGGLARYDPRGSQNRMVKKRSFEDVQIHHDITISKRNIMTPEVPVDDVTHFGHVEK
jgi:hypothetical protein